MSGAGAPAEDEGSGDCHDGSIFEFGVDLMGRGAIGPTKPAVSLHEKRGNFAMRIPVMRLVLLMAIVIGTGSAWAKPSVSDLREQLKTAEGEDLLRVIHALGQSHSGQAVQPLLDTFDVAHIGLPESRYIVEALGELGDARAVPYLSNAWIYLKSSGVEDKSMPIGVVVQSQLVRRAIVDALSKIGGDGVIDILVDAARGDSDFLIVEHACQALRRLKPKAMAGLNCPNPS